jgi:hypothetical protein
MILHPLLVPSGNTIFHLNFAQFVSRFGFDGLANEQKFAQNDQVNDEFENLTSLPRLRYHVNGNQQQ